MVRSLLQLGKLRLAEVKGLTCSLRHGKKESTAGLLPPPPATPRAPLTSLVSLKSPRPRGRLGSQESWARVPAPALPDCATLVSAGPFPTSVPSSVRWGKSKAFLSSQGGQVRRDHPGEEYMEAVGWGKLFWG